MSYEPKRFRSLDPVAVEIIRKQMKAWDDIRSGEEHYKPFKSRKMSGSEFGAIQLLRSKIRDLLNDRLVFEQHAATSAATTTATHLISDLKKEIEQIFNDSLASDE